MDQMEFIPASKPAPTAIVFVGTPVGILIKLWITSDSNPTFILRPTTRKLDNVDYLGVIVIVSVTGVSENSMFVSKHGIRLS